MAAVHQAVSGLVHFRHPLLSEGRMLLHLVCPPYGLRELRVVSDLRLLDNHLTELPGTLNGQKDPVGPALILGYFPDLQHICTTGNTAAVLTA